MENRLSARSRNSTNEDRNQTSANDRGLWIDDPDGLEAPSASYDEMDYVPTSEDDEDDQDDDDGFLPTEFDLDEDEDDEHHDDHGGHHGLHIEFAIGTDDDMDESGEETETDGNRGNNEGDTGGPRRIRVSHARIMQLLGNQASFARILAQHLPSARQLLAEDENDGPPLYGLPRRRRPPKGEYPKVPSDTGRGLMMSGTFGRNEAFSGTVRRKKKFANRLLQRELGLQINGRERNTNKLISQDMIPASNADAIIHYDSKCYSGQFSDDGNFFFSCAQDFRVRMYDTSNPYKWKYYKTVLYPSGQWTITDASLSPDNKFLAYSSIRNVVCLAPTDPGETGDPWHLDFSENSDLLGSFGIWSIRFSGDGREIVAGTSDQTVRVYDIETRKTILKVRGHSDDVNAVCFGDSSSPHILYSGSDDTTLRIWDRRSMGDNRGAGVFLGHTEGLTYVDSKGDGRYVLSNSKDQTMKLWDLRKMSSTDLLDSVDPSSYSTGFDYRFEPYVEDDYVSHPCDGSLVTFRGHRVLKTLIRCHFSPPGSTDSRYVYSGSEDGSVYVYNMDATLAGKIDVNEATRAAGRDIFRRGSGPWKTCVRDASWHPYAPAIAATSWNGWRMSSGTCTLHTWNDGVDDDEAEPKMGTWLDPKLQQAENRVGSLGLDDGYHTRSWARAHVIPDDDDDDDDDDNTEDDVY